MAQTPYKPKAFLPGLSPAYFSMVMATGIVSIGAWRLDWPVLARVLFGINIVVYVLLWVLYTVRLVRYPRRVVADVYDHLEGMGFFTIVAATAILGSQFLLLTDSLHVAVVLLLLAIALWLALTYSIFAVFTIISTRAGVNWISRGCTACGCQSASACTCSRVTRWPSSLRSRFSSNTLRL